MSKRRSKPTPRTTRTTDSYVNFEARVGIGTNNQASAGHYAFDFVSRNRVQIEAAYRSSWIVGVAVDVVAEDMTREGIDISSTAPPDDIDKLQQEAEKLNIWGALCETSKWARLYGGAIAVLLIDGQDVSTPLRMDTIAPGAFRGLLVLDRWLVQPSLSDLVTEFGPDMGMPRYYDTVVDAQAMPDWRIHHSRVIRIDGVDLPYWQRIAENGWGQSVIERLWDRLVAFDSITQGAAQLVYKAHLRTFSVKDLRNLIAGSQPGLKALVEHIDMIRRFQSNEGLTLMDAEDKFDTHQYSFAGLSDMLLQFGQQLSGALQIPLVRLFGQSPAGLNATGESDLVNYYDNIATQQDRKLRRGVGLVYDVLWRSVFSTPIPDGFGFEFTPLWQLSDVEKGTLANQLTTSVTDAYESGLVSKATALKELRQSSKVTGLWSNITSDDIEAAQDDDPPPPENQNSGWPTEV